MVSDSSSFGRYQKPSSHLGSQTRRMELPRTDPNMAPNRYKLKSPYDAKIACPSVSGAVSGGGFGSEPRPKYGLAKMEFVRTSPLSYRVPTYLDEASRRPCSAAGSASFMSSGRASNLDHAGSTYLVADLDSSFIGPGSHTPPLAQRGQMAPRDWGTTRAVKSHLAFNPSRSSLDRSLCRGRSLRLADAEAATRGELRPRTSSQRGSWYGATEGMQEEPESFDVPSVAPAPHARAPFPSVVTNRTRRFHPGIKVVEKPFRPPPTTPTTAAEGEMHANEIRIVRDLPLGALVVED